MKVANASSRKSASQRRRQRRSAPPTSAPAPSRCGASHPLAGARPPLRRPPTDPMDEAVLSIARVIAPLRGHSKCGSRPPPPVGGVDLRPLAARRTIICLPGYTCSAASQAAEWGPQLRALERTRVVFLEAPRRGITCYGRTPKPLKIAWHDYFTDYGGASRKPNQEETIDVQHLLQMRRQLHNVVDQEVRPRLVLGPSSVPAQAALLDNDFSSVVFFGESQGAAECAPLSFCFFAGKERGPLRMHADAAADTTRRLRRSRRGLDVPFAARWCLQLLRHALQPHDHSQEVRLRRHGKSSKSSNSRSVRRLPKDDTGTRVAVRSRLSCSAHWAPLVTLASCPQAFHGTRDHVIGPALQLRSFARLLEAGYIDVSVHLEPRLLHCETDGAQIRFLRDTLRAWGFKVRSKPRSLCKPAGEPCGADGGKKASRGHDAGLGDERRERSGRRGREASKRHAFDDETVRISPLSFVRAPASPRESLPPSLRNSQAPRTRVRLLWRVQQSCLHAKTARQGDCKALYGM